MQRRDSLGETTKIHRLSTGSTRRFESRRRQSSIGSICDVFACEAASEGHSDLSMSGMKLRKERRIEMVMKGGTPRPERLTRRKLIPLRRGSKR